MNHSLLRMAPLAVAVMLAGCFDNDDNKNYYQSYTQPVIKHQAKPLLELSGYTFKDSNNNGMLDPYEDWRLSSTERAADLVGRMTLAERTGMMLIDTLNADFGGAPPDLADKYINHEHMTRFIFRNAIVESPVETDSSSPMSGQQITARQAAEFMNSVQKMAEEKRLGIPLLFKSNARNHIDPDARAGINVSAGSFSSWPKEAGLAATGDMALIKEFAETMHSEWSAIGLRSMYGYMMDLATEPRWYRVHETFTEDADLASDILYALVKGLQGDRIDENSIALTIKHFPGGGPQEDGADPHYEFGQNQVYPTNNFDYHVKPFKAAIAAGASSMMPYYGIAVDQGYDITVDGKQRDVGMAFSKGVVTDLLRGELGFTGYVNSDTGIIGDRAWGLTDKSKAEHLAIAIEAGNDVFSGFNEHKEIMDLVTNGTVTEERVNLSVTRMLKEQFDLGLFENPYVDPDHAEKLIGSPELQARADLAQRKSIVLLQNENKALPLPVPTTEKPVSLYTMGLDAEVAGDEKWGFTIVDGDAGDIRPSAEGSDYALIRVSVSNKGALEVDPDLYFGGAIPAEMDILAFSEMPGTSSWEITPSLEDIRAVMNEVGAEKTILSIYFRYPYVLDEASGMKKAGGILATYGASDSAVMDIISGKFNPKGKLPISLANNADAIKIQDSDAPGYDEKDTLFPFGHGLSYEQANSTEQ